MRLKRKIALDMCKNGWALYYVVNSLNMINNMTRVSCSKSRFVISVCESTEIREHMEESHFGIINRKMWSKCYCRTSKRKQFTTIKYKMQNNRKIQETQTSVTSTTKAEQGR